MVIVVVQGVLSLFVLYFIVLMVYNSFIKIWEDFLDYFWILLDLNVLDINVVIYSVVWDIFYRCVE